MTKCLCVTQTDRQTDRRTDANQFCNLPHDVTAMVQLSNRSDTYSPLGELNKTFTYFTIYEYYNCDCRLPVCVCPSTSEFGSSSVSRSLTASITSPRCSDTRKCTFDDSYSRGSSCRPSSIDASTLIGATMKILYTEHV